MNKKLCACLLAVIVMAMLIGIVVSSRIVAAQPSQPQLPKPVPATGTSPQKWSYHMLSSTMSTVQREIYQLGEQGFEIAGFEVTTYNDGTPYYHILFKRPKP